MKTSRKNRVFPPAPGYYLHSCIGIICRETDQWYMYEELSLEQELKLRREKPFQNINKIITATLLTDGFP